MSNTPVRRSLQTALNEKLSASMASATAMMQKRRASFSQHISPPPMGKSMEDVAKEVHQQRNNDAQAAAAAKGKAPHLFEHNTMLFVSHNEFARTSGVSTAANTFAKVDDTVAFEHKVESVFDKANNTYTVGSPSGPGEADVKFWRAQSFPSPQEQQRMHYEKTKVRMKPAPDEFMNPFSQGMFSSGMFNGDDDDGHDEHIGAVDFSAAAKRMAYVGAGVGVGAGVLMGGSMMMGRKRSGSDQHRAPAPQPTPEPKSDKHRR